jgi:uncharacterized membrane protein
MLKLIWNKLVAVFDVKKFFVDLVSATLDGTYARCMVIAVLLTICVAHVDKFIAYERGVNTKTVLMVIAFVGLLFGSLIVDAMFVIGWRVWKRLKEEDNERGQDKAP